jgi:hypothetical protein
MASVRPFATGQATKRIFREVAEAALAHVIGDAAERAYRRGDALEKRRTLMEAWARFLEPSTRGNVVNLPAGE